MLSEQVERLERARMADPLDKWLATLTPVELDAVEAWLAANENTVALRIAGGEDPVSILKGTHA